MAMSDVVVRINIQWNESCGIDSIDNSSGENVAEVLNVQINGIKKNQ